MTDTPNVVYLITHDTGRRIGPYGRGVTSPNMERLAAGGVRLDNCFCTSPQCSPSRASALTGLMPHSHGLVGLTHRGFSLHATTQSLPQMLSAAGYYTCLVGFQHETLDPAAYGYQRYPADRGENRAAVGGQVAADFLRSRPSQPFFLALGMSETHRDFPSSGDAPLDDIQVPAYLPDTPEVRRDLADFNVSLAAADRAVGQVLDALDETGLADNTLVIYTTDHGIAFPGAKGTLFDPGVEIASLMRWPGHLPAGQAVRGLASNVDYTPTIAAACGLTPRERLHGVDLLPMLRGELDEVRDAVFLENTFHAGYDPMRGVRTQTHKYIRSYELRPYWFGPNTDNGATKQALADDPRFRDLRPAELLFDLVADPNETHNLTRDPAAAPVLDDLRQRVDDMIDRTDDAIKGGVWGAGADKWVTHPTWFQPRAEY